MFASADISFQCRRQRANSVLKKQSLQGLDQHFPTAFSVVMGMFCDGTVLHGSVSCGAIEHLYCG